MSKTVIGSLGRIADFSDKPYAVEALEKTSWATSDYVLGEVTGAPSELYNIETVSGDMVDVDVGDFVIGAFGHRAATLEGVGSWMDIRDRRMHCLTNAGLFGAFTSISTILPDPISLEYRGHIVRDGTKVTMRDFALRAAEVPFNVPTVLLIGTSMSAGKTTTGRLACEVMSAAGLNVIGAKLTGAGRYRDVLSFRQAGASEIYDFVDVGLPSTVVPEAEFREAIRPLLWHIAGRKPDFLVAEAGASPLEPYNGSAAIEELGDQVRCRILCASDPYAVVGVQQAFRFKPDLIAGPATNTSAAIDLVEKLTGVTGINVLDPESIPDFRALLAAQLDTPLDPLT